ncbi:Cytochrome P450 [Glarea lozoyensis ATCC 20868]|uniref:Cytochrome P450 n=1 Tax=Glarea lozoyensis (strain ATCC 20868 / MF5171) TaxID=1116229 RepID=S3DVV8_GLAL2|nr:Cytochrome P450 [Glarea lozoyensis ATCC 20868]EPE30528.1 Cytochrome P450 [Glarea lozoyensis ATCC 20868]
MDEMTVKDIQYITSNINSLWMASKDCSLEPLPQKKALLEQLSNIFSIFPPLDPNGDSRNPLNIILPAYETLWRVVLRCFLEVHFRATSNQAEMQDSLNSLMSCPTQETFEDVSAEGISAKVIVREALRLYPPTRRIHRLISPINPVPHGPWYQLLNLLDMAPTNDPEVIHAIDVEHLHRTPEIWGEDSLTFNPSRTHDAKQVGFMPFGARPFVCPAGNSFAPMMIGICVGALIKAFPDDAEGEGWKLMDVEGKRVDLAKIDGPLDNGREGFSGLVLTRC